jgi:glycosyltransferase involved in cell wall biosynthesis
MTDDFTGLSRSSSIQQANEGGPTILLDMSPLFAKGRHRGLGRYAFELRRALLSSPYQVSEYARATTPRRRHTDFVDLAVRQGRLLSRGHDLFHAASPVQVPLWSPKPLVVSVLDLAPLDLPGYRQTGMKYGIVYRAIRRADRILTISQFSAGRIIDRLGVPADRIHVAPLPLPIGFMKAGTRTLNHLVRPYVLLLTPVDVHDPRKRLHWLARIAPALAAEGIATYVVGNGTEVNGALPPGCLGLGRLSDPCWKGTLLSAEALLVISAYEGQGLPALEAMSIGVPVVAMQNSATREVVDQGGILIPEADDSQGWSDPIVPPSTDTVRAITDAVVSLAFDHAHRAELSRSAILRSDAYSAAAFRQGVLRTYDAAVRFSR